MTKPKWEKSKKKWFFPYGNIPKDLKKEWKTCPNPKCGENVTVKNRWDVRGVREIITFHQWNSLSIIELRNILKIKCHNCFKEIPLTNFSERMQDFVETFYIIPQKQIATKFFNAKQVKINNQEIDLKIPRIIEIGLKKGGESIEIKCGQCKKISGIEIIDIDEKIVQCMNCGYYNKLVF